MDLSLIFTVPGKPGLYKLISQGKNSAVVESLLDKKRMPIFTMDRVSSLAEIAIYTNDSEISLSNVFRNIYQKENGAKCMGHNEAPEKVQAYFAEVLPDFDQERVYLSNIRKVLQWYNILIDNNLVDMELSEREKAQIEGLREHEEEEAAALKQAQEESPAGSAEEKPAEVKPKASEKPKAAARPKAPKTSKEAGTEVKAAKPAAKKTAAKKEE